MVYRVDKCVSVAYRVYWYTNESFFRELACHPCLNNNYTFGRKWIVMPWNIFKAFQGQVSSCLEKLTAPWCPNRPLCSKCASLVVVPRSLKGEWRVFWGGGALPVMVSLWPHWFVVACLYLPCFPNHKMIPWPENEVQMINPISRKPRKHQRWLLNDGGRKRNKRRGLF